MTDTATHLDEFTARLDFPLDEFQVRGCRAVEADRGVLVCAPTGAGKTIVGEFAVSLALSRGTKCFYTTPIKALSNQKFHDLVEVHGEDSVGLLTGDVSVNATAEIVVMTTEVLRNMIYAGSPALDRLSHVVMDEVHFLADRSRGPVWEEVILNLDESVRIIGLSATVSNSEEFGAWLRTVRGDVEVIVSEHRPVPLDQWMLLGRKLYPLFEPGTGGDVNRELEKHVQRLNSAEIERGASAYSGGGGFRSRSGGGGDDRADRRHGGRRSGHPREGGAQRPMGRPEVLRVLQGNNMLPAITFIFSRAGCDGALHQCLGSRLTLTSEEEASEIGRIIDAGVAEIPEVDLEVLRFRQWRAALTRGFAAHHAGMLPAFRHIVEELFTRGLVRAVFATETLALGINMPARSVVLEKLVKYNGEAHVDLTPGEYTQLTGRAGRRGIDTMGNAVVQYSPAVDPRAVAGLASTRTYPLISTFQPGYNMSVNLIRTIGYGPAHRLLEKSFAQFQADGSVVDEVREIERAERRVAELRDHLERAVSAANPPSVDGDPVGEFLDYIRIRSDLSKQEKKARRHHLEDRHTETVVALRKLQIGDVIALPTKKRPMLAVVVTPAPDSKNPRPWIITETGWSGRVNAESFAVAPQIVGHMSLGKDVQRKPRKNARIVVQQFRRGDYPRPKRLRHETRVRDTAEVRELRAELRAHPAHGWADRETLARTAEKLVRRQRDLDRLTSRVSAATDTLGRTFDRIVDLLAEMDYLEFVSGEDGAEPTPVITEEGERLAQIHNESDLLVAQCLRRGVWNDLDPAELAGVVSMCTFQNRREVRGGSPDGATDRMATAMNATMRIHGELVFDEQRHNLPVTREPEAGFALAIHQWTAGAPMGYCMAAAAESGAELTPGDFVRWCRQVVDLLEQVAKTGYTTGVRHNARAAIDAIRRGVVALGS
ncbi:DEAD/DEAH box helicase [Corynebacterium pygosceleis]|uniref:RNA helicase n=1 Tax=Corynebacterium pygosceleis TaxID=2800406 RepID=A0A9Q4C6E0_9CORY|nr:RNA helicase [Corynebacterium pygosceleis]MCK7637063.1 RNA helicase [Corynebacterium pygosceleis]MCL0120165.1 RNA helicase [Corynebacterium pygosceleis]MCX7467816.1 RNA helicase [Corynebacterium pygosceleis]